MLSFDVRHYCAMKTSRKIQFGAAALLLSTGCGLLLIDAATGFATICFCTASFLLHRPKLSRPVPATEIWALFGVLVALAAVVILANDFIPHTSSEHFIRHPLVVALLWAAAMAALFWHWSRERRLADA